MPIKTLGSLGKIRVGRVTGNTHTFFGLKKLSHANVSIFEKLNELNENETYIFIGTVENTNTNPVNFEFWL